MINHYYVPEFSLEVFYRQFDNLPREYLILLDNFRKELDPYGKNLHSAPFCKKPVPKPFENIYTLYAQTDSEEYGRTKRYLIIGCMTYEKE